MDVQKWTLLWVATTIGHYQLGLSNFGFTKDFCMSSGTVVQLMAAWQLGGSDLEVGWSWVKIVVLEIFCSVGIQDFRDVPGDLATRRRTTPIFLGDLPGKPLYPTITYPPLAYGCI